MTIRSQLGHGESPGSIPEALAQIAIANEDLDVFGEARSIARIEHESPAALDQLWQAAPAADENRPSGRQCLEGGERRVLLTQRWHDEEPTSRNGSVRIARIDPTHELSTAQTEPSAGGYQIAEERTIPDDPERRIAGEGKRLQQNGKALLVG